MEIKIYSKNQLTEILNNHHQWVINSATGVKANLSNADLGWADLRGANLRGANLRGANLSNADLSWAFGIISISGMRWPVVIYYHEDQAWINIGCQVMSATDWWAITDEQIARMDCADSAPLWIDHRPVLQILAATLERAIRASRTTNPQSEEIGNGN